MTLGALLFNSSNISTTIVLTSQRSHLCMIVFNLLEFYVSTEHSYVTLKFIYDGNS